MPASTRAHVNDASFFHNHLCPGIKLHLNELTFHDRNHPHAPSAYYHYPSLIGLHEFTPDKHATELCCGYIGSGPVALANISWLIQAISEHKVDHATKASSIRPNFFLLEARLGLGPRGHSAGDPIERSHEVIRISREGALRKKPEDALPTWLLQLQAFGNDPNKPLTFADALHEGVSYHVLSAQMLFQTARAVYYAFGSVIHLHCTHGYVEPDTVKDAHDIMSEFVAPHNSQCHCGNQIPKLTHALVSTGNNQPEYQEERHRKRAGLFILPENRFIYSSSVPVQATFTFNVEAPDQRFKILSQKRYETLQRRAYAGLEYEHSALRFLPQPQLVGSMLRFNRQQSRIIQAEMLYLQPRWPVGATMGSLLRSDDLFIRNTALKMLSLIRRDTLFVGLKLIHIDTKGNKSPLTWDQLLAIPFTFERLGQGQYGDKFSQRGDAGVNILLGNAAVSGGFFDLMVYAKRVAYQVISKSKTWQAVVDDHTREIEQKAQARRETAAESDVYLQGIPKLVAEDKNYRKLLDAFMIDTNASLEEVKRKMFEAPSADLPSTLHRGWIQDAWLHAVKSCATKLTYDTLRSLMPCNPTHPLQLTPARAEEIFGADCVKGIESEFPSSYASWYDSPRTVEMRTLQEEARKELLAVGAEKLDQLTYAEVPGLDKPTKHF